MEGAQSVNQDAASRARSVTTSAQSGIRLIKIGSVQFCSNRISRPVKALVLSDSAAWHFFSFAQTFDRCKGHSPTLLIPPTPSPIQTHKHTVIAHTEQPFFCK